MAIVSVALFELWGGAYYLIAGVLVGNVWKAWRRVHARRRKIRPFPETSHVIVSR